MRKSLFVVVVIAAASAAACNRPAPRNVAEALALREAPGTILSEHRDSSGSYFIFYICSTDGQVKEVFVKVASADAASAEVVDTLGFAQKIPVFCGDKANLALGQADAYETRVAKAEEKARVAEAALAEFKKNRGWMP